MEGDQPRLPRSLTLEEFLEEDHGSPGSPPGSRVDQDRWKLFTEAFGDSSKQSKTGLTRFIKAMHAAIETGEALPITVWKHKKERGLKALTEPLALKLRSVRNGEVQTQKLQVAAEPLLQLADLTRFLTKVTPCVDEAYLHFCHRIIGHRIRDFRSEKEYEVKSFEIYTLGLPIPIHTVMATDGEATESWVLANRTYHILGDLAATNVAQLELKVAFNIIQALSGDYMASLEQLQERLDGAEAAKISEATLAAALASALQMAEANRQEVLDFLAAEKARCASLGNLQLTIASQSQRRGASVAPLAKLMGTVPDSLVEELLQRRASWSTLSTAEMTVGEVNIKRPDLNRCIALGQRPHTSHIRLFFEERTEKEAGEELTKLL